MTDYLNAERAVRVLRAKASDLEHQFQAMQDTIKTYHQLTPVDLSNRLVYTMADVAFAFTLLADEIERSHPDYGPRFDEEEPETGDVMFTLPIGYRPPAGLLVNTTDGQISIDPAGAVTFTVKDWDNPAELSLVDDLADVLVRIVVGWENETGIDLTRHPDVLRVMARYREERS